MTPEKLASLIAYEAKLKERLNSDVPVKHAHRAEQFKAMLQKDLCLTQAKINEARLADKPSK